MKRAGCVMLLIPLITPAADTPPAAVCTGITGLERLTSAGLEFSRKEQYIAAADCYRKALAIDPKLLPAQLNLGLAEFKLGHFGKALPPFRAALQLDPSSFQARTLLGMSYYGAGDYAEASRTIAPAVASAPDNANLRYILAQSSLWAGQYDEAQKQFEWLLQKDPNSAEAHILLGEALDGLRRTEEAIAEFQAAAAASPSTAGVHFGLGYLYWKQHKDPEAEREFRLEIERDSSHGMAWAYLADTLLREGKTADVPPALARALKLDPQCRLAHLDGGILSINKKDYVRAKAELEKAAQLDPAKSDAHFQLARLYRETGRDSQARAEFEILQRLKQKEKEEELHKVNGPAPKLNQQDERGGRPPR